MPHQASLSQLKILHTNNVACHLSQITLKDCWSPKGLAPRFITNGPLILHHIQLAEGYRGLPSHPPLEVKISTEPHLPKLVTLSSLATITWSLVSFSSSNPILFAKLELTRLWVPLKSIKMTTDFCLMVPLTRIFWGVEAPIMHATRFRESLALHHLPSSLSAFPSTQSRATSSWSVSLQKIGLTEINS